jgi:predicted MPP superfamily phosphohydrolase
VEATRLPEPEHGLKFEQEPVVITTPPDIQKLAKRVSRVHLRQRIGIEEDHARQIFGQGRTFFHIENWNSIHALIRLLLRCLGIYSRGKHNAMAIQTRQNTVVLNNLPKVFDDFTILHITDLHLDMDPSHPSALIHKLRDLNYDICVMTGDFRARTFGDYKAALRALENVCAHIKQPIYAVLGNHDTIRMVPAMEEMGIQMLINETISLQREDANLYISGIDDPHFFQLDNIQKAAEEIPSSAPCILLSHSPEPYRKAAHAGFNLMLSGHTHGGQVCLPGGFALMTNADCPRRYCRGAWQYHTMHGYTSVGSGTSVVGVRYNCPPELVLHHLRCG